MRAPSGRGSASDAGLGGSRGGGGGGVDPLPRPLTLVPKAELDRLHGTAALDALHRSDDVIAMAEAQLRAKHDELTRCISMSNDVVEQLDAVTAQLRDKNNNQDNTDDDGGGADASSPQRSERMRRERLGLELNDALQRVAHLESLLEINQQLQAETRSKARAADDANKQLELELAEKTRDAEQLEADVRRLYEAQNLVLQEVHQLKAALPTGTSVHPHFAPSSSASGSRLTLQECRDVCEKARDSLKRAPDASRLERELDETKRHLATAKKQAEEMAQAANEACDRIEPIAEENARLRAALEDNPTRVFQLEGELNKRNRESDASQQLLKQLQRSAGGAAAQHEPTSHSSVAAHDQHQQPALHWSNSGQPETSRIGSGGDDEHPVAAVDPGVLAATEATIAALRQENAALLRDVDRARRTLDASAHDGAKRSENEALRNAQLERDVAEANQKLRELEARLRAAQTDAKAAATRHATALEDAKAKLRDAEDRAELLASQCDALEGRQTNDADATHLTIHNPGPEPSALLTSRVGDAEAEAAHLAARVRELEADKAFLEGENRRVSERLAAADGERRGLIHALSNGGQRRPATNDDPQRDIEAARVAALKDAEAALAAERARHQREVAAVAKELETARRRESEANRAAREAQQALQSLQGPSVTAPLEDAQAALTQLESQCDRAATSLESILQDAIDALEDADTAAATTDGSSLVQAFTFFNGLVASLRVEAAAAHEAFDRAARPLQEGQPASPLMLTASSGNSWGSNNKPRLRQQQRQSAAADAAAAAERLAHLLTKHSNRDGQQVAAASSAALRAEREDAEAQHAALRDQIERQHDQRVRALQADVAAAKQDADRSEQATQAANQRLREQARATDRRVAELQDEATALHDDVAIAKAAKTRAEGRLKGAEEELEALRAEAEKLTADLRKAHADARSKAGRDAAEDAERRAGAAEAELEAVKAAAKRAQSDLVAASQEAEDLRDALQAAEARAKAADAEARKLRNENASLAGDLDDQMASAARARAAAAAADAAKRQQETATANGNDDDIAAADDASSAAKARIAALEAALRDSRADLEDAMQAIDEAGAQAAHQDEQIAQLRRKLTKSRSRNNSRSPSRDASLTAIRDENASARQRVIDLEEELEHVSGERDGLKRRVAALTQERDQLAYEQEADEAELKSLRMALEHVERRLKSVEADRDPLRDHLQTMVNGTQPNSPPSGGGRRGGPPPPAAVKRK